MMPYSQFLELLLANPPPAPAIPPINVPSAQQVQGFADQAIEDVLARRKRNQLPDILGPEAQRQMVQRANETVRQAVQPKRPTPEEIREHVRQMFQPVLEAGYVPASPYRVR
jgi:hypothetical protein